MAHNTLTDLKIPHFKHWLIPSKKKSKKVMVVLHGRGDSIKPFKSFDSELKVKDINYILIEAPRKFLNGYSWYAEPPSQHQSVLKLRSKLFDVIASIEEAGIQSKDIVLFGFSQGCLASADLALNYPKKFGGVVGISGYFHFYPRWRQSLSEDALKTPWILTHGHKDDVLPIDVTQFGVRKLKSAGLKVDWIEMDKKHDLVTEEYPLIRKWVKQKLQLS